MPKGNCNHCYNWHRAGDPPLIEAHGYEYHQGCLREHRNLRALRILAIRGFTLEEVVELYQAPAVRRTLEARSLTPAEINTVMLGIRSPNPP